MVPEILEAIRGPHAIPALGVLVILYFITSSFLSWYRLRHFKGPFLASFSYLWIIYVWRSGQQSQKYKDINTRYGFPLARIGPNELITSDPDLIRRISAARSPYVRSFYYGAIKMKPGEDSLFSITDTAEHDRLKARASFGYSGKENPLLEPQIDEQLAGLISAIERKYVSQDGPSKPMDLARMVQYFTLDVITRIAYGDAFGYLATESDVHGYIEAVEAFVPFMTLMSEVPPVGRIIFSKLGTRLLAPKKTDKKGYGKLLAVAERVVSDRFTGSGVDEKIKDPDRRDMLAAFLRHGIDRNQCEGEVLFQIVAGSDTTATAIRGTMLYLMAAHTAYAKLQKEIDDAIAEGRISSPVTAEEGKKLPYLQAVIYEGMRMQLPFSGLLFKQTPPEGDTFKGVFIPGNTCIGHNTLAIQRSTEVFGEDVDVFRPERWIDADPTQHMKMVQTTELVFGYGRWACLGKPVAFIELNKVYVELLRRFDFQLINPLKPWHEWNHNMFFQSEMFVRVTER